MNIDISTLKILIQHPKYKKKVQWWALTLLIIIATSLISYTLLIEPPYKKYKSSNAQFRLISQKTASLNRTKKELEQNSKKLTENKKLLDHYNALNKDYNDYIYQWFINDTKHKALKFTNINYTHDVRLNKSERKLKRKEKKEFIKSRLKLDISGSYEQIGRYITYINSLPILFNTDLMSIKSDKSSQKLTLSLTVQIYFVK